MGARDAIVKALMGIKAYHGSPHSFDKFDLSKIGTGEGAQAYGHGLYFAGNEDVARGYRDKLKGIGIDYSDPAVLAGMSLNSSGGNIAKAIKQMEFHRDARISGVPDDIMNSAIDLVRSGKASPIASPTGHMYEVNINADPAQMLNWDKPLLQQPPNVQSAFSTLGVHTNDTSPYWMNSASNAFAERTGQWEGAAGAGNLSKALAQTGDVPGIRYLDQGSRGAGAGSSNYVVFDPANIDILRKYGIAAAPAGALGMGAIADQSQYEVPQ